MAHIASRPDVAAVFPVHRNPHVRRAAEQLCGQPNVLLIDPVGYPELVFLLKRCHFVVTDSGGIQEEPFPLENRCWLHATRPSGRKQWSGAWPCWSERMGGAYLIG
jgi:UDP-N-acetylglucosamine 2-epimerase